ncbi:MAG: hypothetical protein QOI03_394 [Solirubrobacteraceae bacterium]|nr:hypothetical protein [Solirubrobacteraceae bacterium]
MKARLPQFGRNFEHCYRVFIVESPIWPSMEVSALRHSGSTPSLRGPSALLRLQSDERLIALTRRGQPAAFETLCARYQSRLLSFCRHMLGSREDAEDVLQEVFAAAFNAVLADERAINARPWLYRIARNRSLNHLRRATAIGVDSMDVHFADHGISTGDRVLRRESFRELIADVHQLPETQRSALLLREIDALSYEQIALAMETTVPSVKSLLVRARISLAEAAEARKLNCDQVRLELGETAEGLVKLSNPARRHVRDCERCAYFKKQLKRNNHALAAILPVGPLILFKQVLLAKLGSAGGAHVASGATVGASAGATVGAGAVAGAGAAGGTGFAGGLITAGAGAVATKAVAGLAAAAMVTAGAVAADHAVVTHHRPAARAAASTVSAQQYASEPVVVRQHLQPVSAVHAARTHASAVAHHALAGKAAKLTEAAAVAPVPGTPAPAGPTAVPVTPPDANSTPVSPAPPPTQVTEVSTETTQLPASSTSGAPTTASEPTAPAPSESPSLPTAEPVPVPEAPPSSGGGRGGEKAGGTEAPSPPSGG